MEETNPTNPTTNSTEPIIKGESGTGTSNGESSTVPQTKIEKNVVECRIKFQASDRLRFEDGMKLGQALIDLKLEVGHGDFEKRYKELGVTKEVARTWMKKARGMYKDRHKKKEEAIFTWDIGQGWLMTLENKAAIHMRTDPGGSDKLVGELCRLMLLTGLAGSKQTLRLILPMSFGSKSTRSMGMIRSVIRISRPSMD
jgi:hypothetical protein